MINRSTITKCAAALGIAGLLAAGTAGPSVARDWHHGARHHGYHHNNVGAAIGGIVGGALAGAAVAANPYHWGEPGYGYYGPAYPSYAYEPAYGYGAYAYEPESRVSTYDIGRGGYDGYPATAQENQCVTPEAGGRTYSVC